MPIANYMPIAKLKGPKSQKRTADVQSQRRSLNRVSPVGSTSEGLETRSRQKVGPRHFAPMYMMNRRTELPVVPLERMAVAMGVGAGASTSRSWREPKSHAQKDPQDGEAYLTNAVVIHVGSSQSHGAHRCTSREPQTSRRQLQSCSFAVRSAARRGAESAPVSPAA